MVEATQVYHSKVLTAIRVIAERYAREEVKRQIRASGAKVSQYPSRDIARLALALPEERWKEFIAKASAVGGKCGRSASGENGAKPSARLSTF